MRERTSAEPSSNSMVDATRALLDSLMGGDRDAGKHGKKKSFKDDDLCKHFLIGMCPYAMFPNQSGKASSKSPLGECPKQHSENMKERFEHDPEYESYRRRYATDVQSMLRKMVDELEVKFRRDKVKMNAGTSCSRETADLAEGGAAARELLVNEKMQAAERHAVAGDLELSKQILQEAEELAQQKYRLSRMKESADTWVDELCEVCGRQISWRAPEEIEARKHGRPHPHTMGVWHTGYAKAKDTLAALDLELAKEPKRARKRSNSKSASKDRKKEDSKAAGKDADGRDGHKDNKNGKDGRSVTDKDRDIDRQRDGARRGDRDDNRHGTARDEGLDRDRDRNRRGEHVCRAEPRRTRREEEEEEHRRIGGKNGDDAHGTDRAKDRSRDADRRHRDRSRSRDADRARDRNRSRSRGYRRDR